MFDDALSDRFKSGVRDLRGRLVDVWTSWTAPITPDEADEIALVKFKAEQAARMEVRCRKGVGYFPDHDGPL